MADAADARARARAARQAAVSRLDASLRQFEEAARRAGAHVHRAADAEAAVVVVRDILARAGAHRVVKSKSMATEEIRLRERLEAAGLEVVETDLGEWLVQLAGQPPSHIITPALHLTREQIRRLLGGVAGRELPADTGALAAFARAHLRQRFMEADAGVSGANLLIAETGSLLIVSNEGNARLCTTLPRLHIAVAGVEKVVLTWEDALAVLAVLPRSATGQRITQYVSVITGPRRADDPAGDGPDELHVVLLDNGRSALVGGPAEELLYCIRCGACLNVCPVYRTMGGHAYATVYPGPIGAALTPRLTAGRQGRDLPWASSLCGACREACPVGIQLDDQLIALRAEYPKAASERLAMRAYAAVASRPRAFRGALRLGRRLLLGGRRAWPGPLAAWTRTRDLRRLAARPPRASVSQGAADAPPGPPARPAPPDDATGAAVTPPAAPDATARVVLPSAAPDAAVRPAASRPAPRDATGRVAAPPPASGPAVRPAACPPPGAEATVPAGSPAAPGVAGVAAPPSAAPDAMAPAAVPPAHHPPSPPRGGDTLLRFAARWREAGGDLTLTDAAGLAGAVREALGPGPVSVDPALGPLAAGLPTADASRAAAGLVRADAAAAETGTLVLLSGPHTERRRSLLPPRAVFVLEGAAVHADLRVALAALGLLDAGSPPAAVTLVSGPSRSADIEGELVLGVHGPGDVRVVLVKPAVGPAALPTA